jgi:F0F1-type ATP synthase membrane subunit a
MKSPLEQFDIINVKSISTTLLDISFNNILVPFLFIIIMCIIYFFIFNNKYNVISSYFQSVFEHLYMFVISVIKQQAHNYGLF